jgi:hypothetical protein
MNNLRLQEKEHKYLLKKKFSNKIKLLESRINKLGNRYKCSIHGEFTKPGYRVLNQHSHGCPRCGDLASAKAKEAKGKNRRDANLLEKFPHIHFAESYKGSSEFTKFVCDYHGKFSMKPGYLRTNIFGCPECVKEEKTKTTTEYTIKEIKCALKSLAISKYKIIGFTQSQIRHKNTTMVECICPDHGKKLVRPYRALQGKICSQCSLISSATKRTRTPESYKQRVKELHGTKIQVLEDYKGARTPSLHGCDRGHTWMVVPTTVLKGTIGCPHCHKTGIVKQRVYKLGKRSVQVQGYEYLALDILTKEQKKNPKSILVGLDGKVPVIDYYFSGIKRKHYPDIFIPSENRLIEVKGIWTFGMCSARGQTEEQIKHTFYKNQAKIKAAKAQGFDYEMWVFGKDKTLLKLPKYWYNQDFEKVRTLFN